MIDTIVLLLNEDMYQIIEPFKFNPPFNVSNHIIFKQNPTKKELLAGIYKPRLTLFPSPLRRKEFALKIELSLPKLFFGNNFNELQLKDFKELVSSLIDILKIMGVLVSKDILEQAPISVVHYSKNIALTDGSTPYHYINKIKEANVKLSIDINQTDYRNEGHSFKWHCNSYEVVFYDKIKDLEKAQLSAKRALEKDSEIQLNIFEKLRKRNFKKKFKKLEFLRMEVRLNKRQKIKALFKKLNIKSNLTLKSLFKPSISKKILLHYIGELENKRSNLMNFKATSNKALLAELIINNPDLSPKQIMQVFGLKKAFEEINPRELAIMLTKSNKRSFQRLINDAEKIKLPNKETSLDAIRISIEKFKPLNLKVF